MTDKDYKYFVEKLDQKDRELRVYRESFLHFILWFNKNKKHLDKLPVSSRPKVPSTMERMDL